VRLLFVHQNFPGQFRELAPALQARGHDVRAIAGHQKPLPETIPVLRYNFPEQKREGIHPLSHEVDEWIQRGVAVAGLAEQWRRSGWAPDAILAHPGWGEALFLRDVFGSSSLIIWPELWLRDEHSGGRRGEGRIDLGQRYYLRTKNWLMEGALGSCSLAILPTRYQANCFPPQWQSKIRVIHEGVRDELLQQPRINKLSINQDITLDKDTPVITFASRNLEPMRGFDRFMKGLAILQQRCPRVHAVVAGAWGSSYSGQPQEGKTWKELACESVAGQIDMQRIHFMGWLSHDNLVRLFLRSDLHMYLSKSFVLSWSALEALACGTAILADDNPMLRELTETNCNVSFCHSEDPEALASKMQAMLNNKTNPQPTRQLAEEFLLSHSVNRLEQLIMETTEQVF